jgi:hypothetical protein
MMLGNTESSQRGILSPKQALKLANMYLQNAFNAKDEDPEIARVLYHDIEALLSQAKKSVKQSEDQTMIQEITVTYHELGKLRASLHYVGSDLAKGTGNLG